ncbi:kynurenine formamidase-like [Danaus plexippus]|uniref:kynurenine formamidase-like n=1 Tax=Danaus plexippus TaxID=13037 RepID=UPI002AB13927|nr:kynurenine formamidase-like [Danaus plexippus]
MSIDIMFRYAANDFEAGEHGGTHIDAPYHFQVNGKHVGDIPTEKLIVPCLSAEVAEWITSSYKNIIGVGVDTASVDPGSSTGFDAHKILTKSGLYMLENVKLDENVPDYGCTALILPMKIAKGTGAPLRLVAICPKVTPTNF